MEIFISYTEEQNIKAGKEKKSCYVQSNNIKDVCNLLIRTHARLKAKGQEKIYNENTEPKRLRWLYSGVEGRNKTVNLEIYIQQQCEKKKKTIR